MKPPRAFLFILPWLVSLALAWTLGAHLAPTPGSASILKDSQTPNAPPKATGLPPEHAPAPTIILLPSNGPTNADESIARLHALLNHGSDLLQANPDLYLFLHELPPEHIKPVAEATLQRHWLNHVRSGRIIDVLYARWAAHNLNEAFASAYAIKHGNTRSWALGAVIREYSRQDAVGAFEYYREHLHGKASVINHTGTAVIEALAQIDPARAVRELSALSISKAKPDDSMINGCAQSLLGHVSLRDAIRLANQSEDHPTRRALTCALLEHELRNGNADEALARLDLIEDADDRRETAVALIQSWAFREPEASVKWAMSQEDAATREKTLSKALHVWVADDPVSFASWLNQQPTDPRFDQATEDLVERTLRAGEPDVAFSWALALSDQSERRQNEAQRALKAWLKADGNPDEAFNLIDEADWPDTDKEKLREITRQAQP